MGAAKGLKLNLQAVEVAHAEVYGQFQLISSIGASETDLVQKKGGGFFL